MRERLNEIIQKMEKCPVDTYGIISCKGCRYEDDNDCLVTRIIDALLANGVTVPPCNSGDATGETMGKTKLFPCPFCGHYKPKLVNIPAEYYGYKEIYVTCPVCRAQSAIRVAKENSPTMVKEAIYHATREWNRRVDKECTSAKKETR